MGLYNKTNLKNQANLIRNEVNEGRNTAERIGKILSDIIDNTDTSLETERNERTNFSSSKDEPNGIAPLDASGKVPGKNLPDNIVVSDDATFASSINFGRLRLKTQSGEFFTIVIPFATDEKSGLMSGFDKKMQTDHQDKLSRIGKSNGIAPLDENSKIPEAYLPESSDGFADTDDDVMFVELDARGRVIRYVDSNGLHIPGLSDDDIARKDWVETIAKLIEVKIAEIKTKAETAKAVTDTKGKPNGIAPLDASAKVPGENLPDSVDVISDTESDVISVETDARGRVIRYVDSNGLHIPGLSDDVDETIRTDRIIWKIIGSSIEQGKLQRPETVNRILSDKGKWERAGKRWTGRPMITIHDDDTIDAAIDSSKPSSWMTGGYYSTLYPLLASLGMRGCLSAEGQRIGFTDTPVYLNANGEKIKELQDKAGWEVMCHSMTARYYERNYDVPGINSPLANTILAEGTYFGKDSNNTTSVVDRTTGIQWQIKSDKSGWEKSEIRNIKPYIRNYTTGAVIRYNKAFPIQYQWGSWFGLAEYYGLNASCWVTPNTTSTHANIPLINQICPRGFDSSSNGSVFYNVPPLNSTVIRLMCEGQQLSGYKGETDTDNGYKEDYYKFLKQQVDDAVARGGWLILGLHTYRPCWNNYKKGTLVSEGGTYPDEWVKPAYKDGTLEPSSAMGINDWSEWYPCPGTRLRMLWDLLKYTQSAGMDNVTSKEGFERIGNIACVGYNCGGRPTGPDTSGKMEGTQKEYPHYVMGANMEERYVGM